MYASNGNRLTPVQEQLVHWINEREIVRYKKEKGWPKPWTEDPTIRSTYFCNVHREDDKVTRWIRENIPLQDDFGMHEWRMMVARMINWPETLAQLDLLSIKPEQTSEEVYLYLFDVLAARARNGLKVWGSAYVVTTCGARMDKAQYACEALRGAFNARPICQPPYTLANAHSQIQRHQGFASFMAAQVVADLKNTEGHPLRDAEDWATWSSYGPGSLRGLNWFFYGHKDGADGKKVTPKDYPNLVWTAHSMIERDIPEMCMQDFQNCLCEFDKYMRVSTGAGRSKRNYNG